MDGCLCKTILLQLLLWLFSCDGGSGTSIQQQQLLPGLNCWLASVLSYLINIVSRDQLVQIAQNNIRTILGQH